MESRILCTLESFRSMMQASVRLLSNFKIIVIEKLDFDRRAVDLTFSAKLNLLFSHAEVMGGWCNQPPVR